MFWNSFSCTLPVFREKEYEGDRLFSPSVTYHSYFFVFAGTICYFLKEMREGLPYKLNWLDFLEKASVWTGGNNLKKMVETDVKK